MTLETLFNDYAKGLVRSIRKLHYISALLSSLPPLHLATLRTTILIHKARIDIIPIRRLALFKPIIVVLTLIGRVLRRGLLRCLRGARVPSGRRARRSGNSNGGSANSDGGDGTAGRKELGTGLDDGGLVVLDEAARNAEFGAEGGAVGVLVAALVGCRGVGGDGTESVLVVVR